MGAYDQEIFNELIAQGASSEQAAAIMGNMTAESSLNPESSAMDSNGKLAWGLISWNNGSATYAAQQSRLLTGNVQQDIKNQVAFLISSGGLEALGSGSPQQMASNFAHTYERCAACGYQGGSGQLAVRAGYAGNIWSEAQTGRWNTSAVGSQPNTTAPSPTGANENIPPPPSLASVPQLNEYIQQYYPQYAWLLSQPGVAQVIDQAIAQGYGANTAYMQGQIENSSWWKTTSNAMRQYEQTLATTPGELNFLNGGSQAQQMLAQIQAAAAQQGVQLTQQQLQEISSQALQFGWTAQQINNAIGSDVRFGGQNQTNAATVVQQLQAIAGNYYQNPTPAALQQWAQGVASGTQMAQDAAVKWSGYAPQIMQGQNMVQLTDSLRSNVAQTLEVDPSSINFVTNPAYSKMLDYVAPGDKTGVHRVMTQSEADQYVKSTPQFGYQNTQGARDNVAQLAQSITQSFGKVGQ